MTGAAVSALASHWRRHPGQLAVLVLGLALATALWSAVQAINTEARASYARAAAQLGQGAQPSLESPLGAIPLTRYVDLRRAGWQLAPILEGRAALGEGWVSVMGIDLLTYPALPLSSDPDLELDPAEFLTAPGRLLARPATIARIGSAPGLPPLVATQSVPPGVVMTDIGVAEILLDRTGELSRILVLPDQPMGLAPLSDLAPDLQLQAAEAGIDSARLTGSFHLNLTAFGLLSFAVGLFIVHGAAGLAFQQRLPMFRTLRALGVPLRRLALLVTAELILLALIAGLAGLALGYVIAGALLPDVAATLRGLYGAPVDGGLQLRADWIASGLAIALTGSLVAGAGGLRQLLRQPVLEAPGIRTGLVAAIARARLMALGGVALIVAGAAAPLVAKGLIAGFALLAGMLLGAALILPWALGALIGLVQTRQHGVLAEWVWSDLRAQLPGLSLAMMALLLALAANIGVGTMVSSFRLTFTGWLDQRLSPQIYVTGRSDAEGAAIRAYLGPRTDALLPIRYVETRLMDRPARIYGIIDHPSYRDHWPLIAQSPGAWDRLAAGEGVIINEQLARHGNLWPGDRLMLAPGWGLEITGVYSDYGNPAGEARVALAHLDQRMGPLPDRQYVAFADPDRTEALIEGLRGETGLPAHAVYDQAAIKAVSLAIFERTFAVTAALNVLTLAVAGFAILTSLLTLWTMRLPQLAPVWALGVTRAQLAWLELARSLALAAITALLALPLGLVLAWALLAVVNVEAFGWRLPMFLFPVDWLRLGVLALLAAGLAALIPALRLRRLPPAHLLKVFAGDR